MDLTKAHLHCRISRHKSKTYKSYSIARAVRKDGKNRREILIKLGKLSDDQAHQWKTTLDMLKGRGSRDVCLDDIAVIANYAYLDVAVLLDIWHFWGLTKVFTNDGHREVPLWVVVATLVMNRCVDPSSKSQAAIWFQTTALPLLLKTSPSQINPSRIFRELTAIDSLKPDLCDYLYQEITKRDPESMKMVFYDLSSTTFSGTKCILMSWGYCKEGFENHIVLALVVNQKGLPVYWEVLPGSTADVSTIQGLLINLKSRFAIAQPTLVFDRGMVSEENLSLLEENQIKYITALDRNQLETYADVKFESFSSNLTEEVEKRIMASNTFKKCHESTYFHEVASQDTNRRYILCFNPQLHHDQRQARQESIARFTSAVQTINLALLEAKNSREREATLNKFTEEMSIEQRAYLEIKLRKKTLLQETSNGSMRRITTYQGQVVVNEQKRDNAGRLDGFWMIVTNHTEKDEQAVFVVRSEDTIKPYKDKVVIESSFRDIKSFLEISPIHVWTIEHVKAHYTICVLAYLIDRTLTLRLHENPGECTKEIVSHSKLYRELGKCVLNEIKVAGTAMETICLTRPTEEQKELLERIGLTHLIEGTNIKQLALQKTKGYA
jgi:transposase